MVVVPIFTLLFHNERMDAADRASRRQMALNALNHPTRVSVDLATAAPLIEWVQRRVRSDLEKPETATFSDQRLFRMPDDSWAGAGIVECTNVIGARASNWYLFLVRPDGVPVTVDIIDFDPGGAPRTPLPPPLPPEAVGKR